MKIEMKVFGVGSVIVALLLFSFSFVSAGFFSDIYNGITGKATDGTTSLAVTIGNVVPSITFVSSISAQTATEGGTKNITFTFNATDSDGYGNLNDSTAEARFQRSGETTRLNTSCISIATDTNEVEYECTIGLEYFDGSGTWDINVTVADINEAGAENSTTVFTYDLLTAMVMSPTSLTWGSISLGATDSSATNNPIVLNNTGNDISLTINVTGYDLAGTTTTTEYIFANNFTIENTAGCGGDTMDNATSVNVTTTILQSGNNSIDAGDDTSGQEELYFCLKGVPQDISSQDYASAISWNVEIIS